MKKIRHLILIVFSITFLTSCKDAVPSNPISTQPIGTSTGEKNKAGNCDINHFIVFNKNSTIDSVCAYLKRNNTIYQFEKSADGIEKQYKIRIYIGAPFCYNEDCPCANFIIVPTFRFDKYRFKNVVFVFYNNKLASIVLQEVKRADEHSEITELSELYNKKYGGGESQITALTSKWVYKNKGDGTYLFFLSSEDEIDENLDLYDKVTGERFRYHMMNFIFTMNNNLSQCCKEWWQAQKKMDSLKQKRILDKI